MTVINLHRTLVTEVRDMLQALYGDVFSDRMVDRIVRRLLAPKRLKQCKRLAYFVAAVGGTGIDPLEVIFDESPAASKAIGKLRRDGDLSGAVSVSGAQIGFRYSDGEVFEIPAQHIPELICTAHVVAEWLEADGLHALIDDVAAAGDDRARIEGAAEGLAARVDRFRQKRMGSSSAAMKRRSVLDFLRTSFDGEKFGASDITSDHVKAYWAEYCDTRNLDVRTYEGVHALFQLFVEVLDEALEVSFSPELDTVDLERSTTGQEDWMALREEAGRLKFLFPKQIEAGKPFTDAPICAWRLRHSAIWSECFSPVQSHLREGMGANSYRDAWSEEREWNYALGVVQSLSDKMQEVVLAVLHMLIQTQGAGAIQLAYYLEGDRIVDKSVDSLNPETATEEDILEFQAFHMALICSSADEPYKTLREKAEKAWRNIQRQGFKPADMEDPKFMESVDVLSARICGAAEYLSRLSRQYQDTHPAEAEMMAVREEFDAVFRKIYRPS